MTTALKDLLVLKSGAGEYFVLPEELLERGRVPAEQRAEAERVFVAAEADDVAGHSLNFAAIKFEYARIKFSDILVSSFAVGSTALDAPFHNVGHEAGQEAAAHAAGQLK